VSFFSRTAHTRLVFLLASFQMGLNFFHLIGVTLVLQLIPKVSCSTLPVSKKPNIVFILVDDLVITYSCYLLNFYKNGSVFRNCNVLLHKGLEWRELSWIGTNSYAQHWRSCPIRFIESFLLFSLKQPGPYLS